MPNMRKGNSDRELELIGQQLAESLNDRIMIEVRLHDPWEQLRVIGMVDRIDYGSGRFSVNGDWFRLDDIEGVHQAG